MRDALAFHGGTTYDCDDCGHVRAGFAAEVAVEAGGIRTYCPDCARFGRFGPVRRARIALSSAANRSHDGNRRAASTHLAAAEMRLRNGGREDLGCRLAAAREDYAAGSSDARRVIREVAQKLDAELEPDVSTASFVAASDGGGRR